MEDVWEFLLFCVKVGDGSVALRIRFMELSTLVLFKGFYKFSVVRRMV